MATNRKLGRTTDIRNAMLKTLTTDLILKGKVETTEARAKEVKAIADSIIALAIKEKDNFETVDAKVVKAKLDSKGNKVTELVKSKNGNEYLKVVKEETTEKRQKDMPSRLNARRKMMRKWQIHFPVFLLMKTTDSSDLNSRNQEQIMTGTGMHIIQ